MKESEEYVSINQSGLLQQLLRAIPYDGSRELATDVCKMRLRGIGQTYRALSAVALWSAAFSKDVYLGM